MAAPGHGWAGAFSEDLPHVPMIDPPMIDPDPPRVSKGKTQTEIRESEPPGFAASSTFKKLVEQLVDQHVKELAAARSGKTLKVKTCESQPLADTRIDELTPTPPSMSLRSPPPSASLKALRSTNSKLSKWGKRSENMRDLQATELLDALETSANLQTRLSSKEQIEEIVNKFDTTGKVVEEILSREKTVVPTDWSEIDRTEMSFSEVMYWWLQSSQFEMCIICLLCANIFWMALELQIAGSYSAFSAGLVPRPFLAEDMKSDFQGALRIVDAIFSGLFLLEVSVRIVVLGKQFWMMWMNYADLLVSLVSAVEVISSLLVIPVSPVLVRILRLGKLARVLRLVSMGSVLQSLQLLLKSLVASIDMLFWSFCLLAFLQCVAGLIISTFCREYIGDDSHDQVQREEVFKYFGTFTRTFLTMFEVLFANWGPPCRVLVENISEWFSVFFLLYRCVIGFAVLNVVGAVFIQQTLKTANSDEELAYRQKEKEIQSYTRKVRKLFQSMDDSGDGALNLEEFSKLVTSPKLSFWMSQLELEYHDLLSLFEFLDNGDGQITLQEFIEGSARFRGGAKALDIWRLETKVEVLFEEMLNLMHTNDSEVSSYVQRAFNESAYSHIKSALRKDTP